MMQSEDDISDFEYSDSDAQSDEIESALEALDALTLEAPRTLEEKVNSAIGDVEALENLIFQIRHSPSAKDLTIDTLLKIVDGGHEDCFNLMIPEFFHQAEMFHHKESRLDPLDPDWSPWSFSTYDRITKFDFKMEEVFIKALALGKHSIVDDLISRVTRPKYAAFLDLSYPSRYKTGREMAMERFLERAATSGEIAIIERLLQGKIDIDDLSSAFRKASAQDRLEAISLLLAKLLGDIGYRPEVLRSYRGADGLNRYEFVSKTLDEQRLHLIESALMISLRDPRHTGSTLLLPAYLNCLARVNHKGRGALGSGVPFSTTDQMFERALSRAETIRLLDQQLPAPVRKALLWRLRSPDDKDEMQLIHIRAGVDFHVYKDILCYWSKYFAALCRDGSTWADRKSVNFEHNITPGVMQIVLNFMYSETCTDVEFDGKRSFLKDVLEAAEYLLIDPLVCTVRQELARLKKVSEPPEFDPEALEPEDKERKRWRTYAASRCKCGPPGLGSSIQRRCLCLSDYHGIKRTWAEVEGNE